MRYIRLNVQGQRTRAMQRAVTRFERCDGVPNRIVSRKANVKSKAPLETYTC